MRADQTTHRLSAITFNTWNCQGDYGRRLAAMTHGLAALTPHVVLLQEVFSDRDGRVNTAKVLAAELGMTCAFHPARTKMRRFQGQPILCSSGLAILSRYPIA